MVLFSKRVEWNVIRVPAALLSFFCVLLRVIVCHSQRRISHDHSRLSSFVIALWAWAFFWCVHRPMGVCYIRVHLYCVPPQNGVKARVAKSGWLCGVIASESVHLEADGMCYLWFLQSNQKTFETIHSKHQRKKLRKHKTSANASAFVRTREQIKSSSRVEFLVIKARSCWKRNELDD